MIVTARAGSNGPSATTASQTPTLNEAHIHVQATVDVAVMVDRDHVRLDEPGRRVRLPPEPNLKSLVFSKFGRQNLERDDPIGFCVVGTPDFAHPAPAQQLQQAVTPELSTLHEALHAPRKQLCSAHFIGFCQCAAATAAI